MTSLKIPSRAMSDTPFSEIAFKNRMAIQWTTLKISFSLEINRPIKKDEPDEFLEQAASTALSTVLKIIDDDNEQNSTDIAINYKTYDSKNSKIQNSDQTNTQPMCSIWPNLKKSLSIWTQDQNNAIDWNYT